VCESALVAHDLALGVRLIAGVDEVGRACRAGPIVAAGVLFDVTRLSTAADATFFCELRDSKRLSRAKRERLSQAILVHAEAVSLVSISPGQIDRIGIDGANATCLELALRALGERADLRLVDGDSRRPLGDSAPPHQWIPQGDGTSATIAAASIVAKVARDEVMARMGERYSGYGFERHKGYGTPEHMVAIAKLGRTPEHRRSFNVRRVAGALPRRPKPRPSSWRALPAAEMAAHLLERPTIGDRLWTNEPRLPRETRTDFVRRILLGE
jgi:ribonuclease HII